ncbi:MAG TPA: hypothetical protein VE650_20545, partial [Acetobacteraceae bacterium]|nr:hypothetical protein [Acetobacteraceae bacterium]
MRLRTLILIGVTLSAPAARAATCGVSELQGGAPSGVVIESAAARPAGSGLPAHCDIAGHLPSPGVDGGPEGR